MQKKLPVWQLRKGSDRRFNAGHPWVYSNELQGSPKGIQPGALVELRNAAGKFLARGFGNPNSLIAFRTLTRDPDTNKDPLQLVPLLLNKAAKLREQMGFANSSCRLFYGESDGIPGLIVDRYMTESAPVYVLQAHTAGADQFIPTVVDWIPKQAAIILRNDVGVRKLEGLSIEEEAKIIRSFKESKVRVREVLSNNNQLLEVDLLQGQKTGLVLDQFANIQLAALLFKNLWNPSSTIKILDLCCYVGQWGAQLAKAFPNHKIEITAVDASASALEIAARNIKAQGASCTTLKADVLKDLTSLPTQSFDLVISDPPALIKGKKDLPQGTHAYLQLATQTFRLVKPGGAVVTCSCSALLDEESFIGVLAKAARRNETQIRWVARGGQSPDHPVLAEFPEGRYLKAWLGIKEE